MKYNLKNPLEMVKAQEELARLTHLGELVELKKVAKRRSLPQNRYLHLLLGAFATHFGYTKEEAKLIYKELNAGLYKYDKNGRSFYKSSRQLTKEEMTKSIEAFRAYSAMYDYPLPEATDQGWLLNIENTMEQMEQYL
jgi:hypothetical protein